MIFYAQLDPNGWLDVEENIDSIAKSDVLSALSDMETDLALSSAHFGCVDLHNGILEV